MSQDYTELLARLGCTLPQPQVLRRALTHRSHSADHNERLEFLGDAVLNLCVSRWLMQKLPEATEGELSRTRANLVNETALHRIALDLQLPQYLLLGEGERKTGGQLRPSILADAVEALIGAIFESVGYDQAQKVVERLMGAVDLSSTARATSKDPKTSLQEWLQAKRLPLPTYSLLGVHGLEHLQTFEVRCEIPSQKVSATGKGASRKAAEQQAAAATLALLAAKEKRRG